MCQLQTANADGQCAAFVGGKAGFLHSGNQGIQNETSYLDTVWSWKP